MAGVYIHIPFCKSFCTYCDFYSVCDEKRIGFWLGSLFREMEKRGVFFSACGNIIPSTLYLGGGTPSRLSPFILGEVARRTEEVFRGGLQFDEFTVEVNPDDVTADFADGIRAAGVTRVSMGVQSFDDAALKWMNRRHTSAGAVEAYKVLREAGFENISMDLIFGYQIPGESEEEGMNRWKSDLARMTALRPEHISAYQMSIEPGSLLGRMAGNGEYHEPSDVYCASQYMELQGMLSDAGYEQYEVSNFAYLPDGGCISPYRSAHNSSYWTREPYIGLGPGAHSFCGNIRSWNPDDVDGYIQSDGMPDMENETLSEEEILEEIIMLGLRRSEGLAVKELDSISPGRIESMLSAGLLSMENGRIRIPADKWFVSDDILTTLLYEQ